MVDEMNIGKKKDPKKRELHEIIVQLQAYLEKRPEVRFAYLFGSWAQGTANLLSDIDVAVYVDTERIVGSPPYGYKAELLTDLMKILKTNRVDLVILNVTSPFLRSEVVYSGISLVCRSEADRKQFEAKVQEEYEEMRTLLSAQAVSVLQRLRKGKFGRP